MSPTRPRLTAPTMLDSLPEPGRDHVLRTARQRSYRRGEILIRQGDEAGSLYIIETGRVAIRLANPNGDSIILAVMGPGDVFGEMAVLVPRFERTATAQAIDDVIVRTLRKDDFDQLRQQHPEANDFLLHVLGRRADRLGRQLVEAYHLPAEKRVIRRLLEVGRYFVDDKPTVGVPLTQDEVAQLAGTTRPTANQILKTLETENLVRLTRGHIELLDVGRLRRAAR